MPRRKISASSPKSTPIAQIGKREEISFSFEYLHDFGFVDAKLDGSFFISFLSRLKKLGSLGWAEIAKSHRHSFGFETIKVSALQHAAQEKMNRYPDVTKLYVFRATGDNHAFLGYRNGNVFNVLFIEYAFDDVYQHKHR